jgi:hypothetical protein
MVKRERSKLPLRKCKDQKENVENAEDARALGV